MTKWSRLKSILVALALNCLIWVLLAGALLSGPGSGHLLIGLLVLALVGVACDRTPGFARQKRVFLGAFMSVAGPFLGLFYCICGDFCVFYNSPHTYEPLSLAQAQAQEEPSHFLLQGPVLCLYPLASSTDTHHEYPVISRDSPFYEACRQGKYPPPDQLTFRIRSTGPVPSRVCLVQNQIYCGNPPDHTKAPPGVKVLDETQPQEPDDIFASGHLPYLFLLALWQGVGLALLAGTLLGREPSPSPGHSDWEVA